MTGHAAIGITVAAKVDCFLLKPSPYSPTVSLCFTPLISQQFANMPPPPLMTTSLEKKLKFFFYLGLA